MKKRFWGLVTGVVLLTSLAVISESRLISPGESAPQKSEVGSFSGESNADNMPSSGNDFQIESQVRYMIIMEQDYLRTYKIENENKSLLHQSQISPLLMTDHEVQKLRKGIWSDSLEEIYLYYESYAS